MNQANINCLRAFQDKYLPDPADVSVLDVGSMAVHGQLPGIGLWPNALYHGVDIAAGLNVHQLIPKSCTWSLGKQFDIVTALSTFEHCEQPWELIKILARHIKPGGYLFIVAPFCFHEHRYPVDCFRYLPDGMKSLANHAGLEVKESYIYTTPPWKERSLTNLFWNAWQIAFKQIVSRECVLVARKPQL
jgi:SAM-dependent methyltransferase